MPGGVRDGDPEQDQRNPSPESSLLVPSDLGDGVGFTDVREELVAESLALRGPGH